MARAMVQDKPLRRGATVKRKRGSASRSGGSSPIAKGLRRSALALLVLLGLGGFGYFSKSFLDQAIERPIRSIGVEGEFVYIAQDAISEMVSPMIVGGFLQLPLPTIKSRLEEHPWIAQAVVSRRWPDQLFISITEEQPIARWSDIGFLNHRGDLVKIRNQASIAGLPLLSGQPGQEKSVMANYQQLAQMLRPHGLKIAEFYSDELYSWNVVLSTGLRIAIGRDQSIEKIQRFLTVYDRELRERLDEVAVVDLRYGNGLAVQWKSVTADTEDSAAGAQAHAS